jgi:hypothetical protein
MADCKIVNAKVTSTVGKINEIKGKYKTAGETFNTDFTTAISGMEGETKDALLDLFNKSYKDFVTSEEKGLPGMIKGLADLLEGNRSNFEKVDSQIASSIRGDK